MQTDELFKNYLILYPSYTFHVFMQSMPGPNEVTEKTMPYRSDLPPATIPNHCRHPSYHILPNTLLVYQCMYIKHQEHHICYILCIYKVNGGGMITRILRPGGAIR